MNKKLNKVPMQGNQTPVVIKGYKAFNEDLSCRDFKYEVGKEYEMDETPECCDHGFHFCTEAADVFNYYNFNPEKNSYL